MSYRKRKIFFYLFFFIFLLAGCAITLYSQGYRLNTKELTLSKIGGIFILSEPAQANIVLDGKPIKNKSWFLQSGTLIDNIIPGSHDLELLADGYRPWHKTIFVEPSLVSEVDSALLVSNHPAKKAKSDVFSITPLGTHHVEKDASGTLSLADTILPGGEFISASPDNQFVLTKTTAGTYLLSSLQPTSATSTPIDINKLFYTLRTSVLKLGGKPALQAVAFHPQSDAELFVATQNGLYLLDTTGNDITLIADTGVQYLTTDTHTVLWEDNQNRLMRYDPVLSAAQAVARDLPGHVTKAMGITDTNRPDIIYLLDSKLLAVTSSTATTSATVATRAVYFDISPDKKKIAFIDEDNKINVESIGLSDKTSFYLPVNGAITSFAWYKDSAHLILKYGDGRVYFTETDGINPVNVYLISDGVGTYFYSETEDALYMLKGSDLYTFPFGQ